MKYSVLKETPPPVDFSLSTVELGAKVLALEVVVEELYHQVQAQRDLIGKLIIRTNPADE